MELLRLASFFAANLFLALALALAIIDLLCRRLGARYERLDSCLGKLFSTVLLLVALGLFFLSYTLA